MFRDHKPVQPAI